MIDKNLPHLDTTYLALASYATVGAQLCDFAASGRWVGTLSLKEICSYAGVPLSQEGSLQQALHVAQQSGIVRQVTPLSWEPLASREYFQSLTLVLRATSLYINKVHQDRDEVQVVLTRPPKPSQLERALEAQGYSYLGLGSTKEFFFDMASHASERLTVMTPFLDTVGANTIVTLFKRASQALRRELIVRYDEGSHLPLQAIEAELQAEHVKVYRYYLDREKGFGYETFHAKAMLIDNAWCYIGSANMTLSSLAYSMEIGLTVKGKAAERIGRVLDAIVSISTKIF